jgi:Uma2 family endonuclease
MSVRVKQWTREEYDRLVAAGAFQPESRIQLVQGEIVEIAPQSARHAAAVRRVSKAMETVFRRGYDVRPQLPLTIGAHSEPEPDIAVVPGSPDDYRDAHPSAAVLVIEIADTTLDFDRTRKQALYAQARIPEYWIVNLVDGVLEVYRDPHESKYGTVQRLGPDDAIAAEAAATAHVQVRDLLL